MLSDDVLKTLINVGVPSLCSLVLGIITVKGNRKTRKHVDTSNEKAVVETVEKVNEKVDEVSKTVRESMTVRADALRSSGARPAMDRPVDIEPEVRRQPVTQSFPLRHP